MKVLYFYHIEYSIDYDMFELFVYEYCVDTNRYELFISKMFEHKWQAMYYLIVLDLSL